MKAYRQVHMYPIDPIGWLTLEVLCVGEIGRVNKGEPFELRPWLRTEQQVGLL